jgi:hypothetical protein
MCTKLSPLPLEPAPDGGQQPLPAPKEFPEKPSSAVASMNVRSHLAILSLGTLRVNRLRGCILETGKNLQRDGRGAFSELVDNFG